MNQQNNSRPQPLQIPIISAAAPVEPGQPCPTLHISNLNEHIHPRHLIAELERILSPFGEIWSVSVKRKLALRGQAFVEFAEIQSAIKVVQSLQSRTLYGKSMVIRFAKRPSNRTVKKQGGKEGVLQERRERLKERLERQKYPRLTRRQRMAQVMAASATSHPMSMAQPTVISPTSMELPNKTVYVQGLPTDASDADLTALFRRYIGFIEFRRVPNRPDLGFVEYETEAQAGVPRQALDRHEMRPGRPIRVSFARR